MQTRFFGGTGLRISSLAFGTMSFGNEADEAESARLFSRCRDAGINLFDCADVYGRGRAEEILGRLMADCRDEIVLTSKGSFPMGRDMNACGASRYHIIRACEASLRRLGTDRIDVYFLHRFDPRTDLEEALRGLEHLVLQGKIRYPAVSNFSAWQTQRVIDLQREMGWTKLACIQPMYNVLKRQAEVEILPMAEHNQVAVLPYSPLAGGLLTGKYATDLKPDVGRLLSSPSYQVRYGESLREEAARFVSFAREHGYDPTALAIAWVHKHPGVTAPLLGARNLAQLEACLKAAELKVDEASWRELEARMPSPPPATDRNDDGSEHDLWKR